MDLDIAQRQQQRAAVCRLDPDPAHAAPIAESTSLPDASSRRRRFSPSPSGTRTMARSSTTCLTSSDRHFRHPQCTALATTKAKPVAGICYDKCSAVAHSLVSRVVMRPSMAAITVKPDVGDDALATTKRLSLRPSTIIKPGDSDASRTKPRKRRPADEPGAHGYSETLRPVKVRWQHPQEARLRSGSPSTESQCDSHSTHARRRSPATTAWSHGRIFSCDGAEQQRA